jgi:RNA polymerase sigma-70 factor (ECF subfamily)
MWEEHAPFVHALALHLLGPGIDPDDLTQEVFFLAWRKLPEYRGGSMRNWLCQMTVKLAAGARRRAWVRHHLGLDTAGELVADQSPERSLEVREANAIFDSAVSAMSDKKRAVFVLSEIYDLSGPEVAEAVGCSVATVYSRLFYARREFEQFMARYGDPRRAEPR